MLNIILWMYRAHVKIVDCNSQDGISLIYRITSNLTDTRKIIILVSVRYN